MQDLNGDRMQEDVLNVPTRNQSAPIVPIQWRDLQMWMANEYSGREPRVEQMKSRGSTLNFFVSPQMANAE
jgi:hypothetical protein